MAERIAALKKEEEELDCRRDILLCIAKDPANENASSVAKELIDIMKKKSDLNERIEKEIIRRRKIDNIGIPIMLISFLAALIFGIVAIVGYFRNGSFSPVSGFVSLGALAIIILDIVVMKILNPDMKL